MSFCCCCCDPGLPGTSRTVNDHLPLSRSPPSSVVSTQAENRIPVTNIYSAPLSPPIPLAISPRDLQTPQKLPTSTLSNSSEVAREITQAFPLKETWPVADLDDVKKQDRETIDECSICLEEYGMENPRLLTKYSLPFIICFLTILLLYQTQVTEEEIRM